MKQRPISILLLLFLLLPFNVYTADNPIPTGGVGWTSIKPYAISIARTVGKIAIEAATRTPGVDISKDIHIQQGSGVVIQKGGILQAVYSIGNYLFGGKPTKRDREIEKFDRELNAKIEYGRHNTPSQDVLDAAEQQQINTNLENLKKQNDKDLLQREQNVSGWKKIQERAVGKYNSYIATGKRDDLKALKADTEHKIAVYEQELEAIKQERLARLNQGIITLQSTLIATTTKTTGVTTGNISLEPVKDPEDKEKTDAVAKDGSKNKAVEDFRKNEQEQFEQNQRDMEEFRNNNPMKNKPQEPDPALHKPPHETGIEPSFPERRDTHTFREKGGHYNKSTANAKKAIADTTTKPENFIGKNKADNFVYRENMPDGKQKWAHIREGKVVDGGISDKPWTDRQHLDLDTVPRDRGTSTYLPVMGAGLTALTDSSDAEATEVKAKLKKHDYVIDPLPDAPGDDYMLPEPPLDRSPIQLPPAPADRTPLIMPTWSPDKHSSFLIQSPNRPFSVTVPNEVDIKKSLEKITEKYKSPSTPTWSSDSDSSSSSSSDSSSSSEDTSWYVKRW